MMQGKIAEIKEKILHYYTDSGHLFDHTERVYNLAVRIAEKEDVDMEAVKLAALLHDVARHKEKKGNGVCHAEEGERMAREILSKEGYGEEKIDKVCSAIRTHRFSKKLDAESREGEIIQDADRLDALGAIIIARVFSRAGAKGKPLYDPEIPPVEEYPSEGAGKTAFNHFKEKILKITPESFKTETAREIAKERYDFVVEFVKRFEQEWRGEL